MENFSAGALFFFGIDIPLSRLCPLCGRFKGAYLRFTGIELFAGAGGLALGLERAGIESVCLVEADKWACSTLRKNRKSWNVMESDIADVDFTTFSDVDVVSGGAPCQSFSYAGKRLGFGDTRGTLFSEFARCVKECSPKMFLFENVSGMLTHDEGRTFKTVLHEFESIGYSVQHKVLDASFFGVGQKRMRLFVVGVRNDLASTANFSFPIPDKRRTVLRDVLRNVPDSPFSPYSEKKRMVLEMVPPGGCWVDLPEDVARDYLGRSFDSPGGKRGIAKRLSWDEPSLTLTTSPSQKQTERCHPDETRPLTIREYARVQSFPDDWQFCGSIANQYKQIGNAVPVELARRIGAEMTSALRRCHDSMCFF